MINNAAAGLGDSAGSLNSYGRRLIVILAFEELGSRSPSEVRVYIRLAMAPIAALTAANDAPAIPYNMCSTSCSSRRRILGDTLVKVLVLGVQRPLIYT